MGKIANVWFLELAAEAVKGGIIAETAYIFTEVL